MERTLRLDLAYDGTGFRGWARQGDPEIRTVEGTLTEHLERILLATPRLSVAGRTDAGVHARGQVVSFRTDARVSAARLQVALNAALAPEVAVVRAGEVPEGFDARRSASAREYRYHIDTAAVPDPFSARYVWHRPGALDVAAMRAAARPLIGAHDFASFCRHPGADRSTVRDLERCTVARSASLVTICLRANAFLHQMVRSLVGTLVVVGDGRMDPAAVAGILNARDRSGTPNVAPGHGLTLERVVYGRRPFP